VKTQIILVAACLVATVTAVSSAAPPAGPPRVTQVVVLDVGANMQKFNDLNSRMDTIAAKYSTGKARFWITTLAGAEVGRVIVTIEYPSLISFAQSQAKLDASPEFQQWQKDAQASGIKALSESLVTELPR
jgi:hypothetical protein